MLHKTRGIVFRFTKYAESSIIVTIFTEHFGLQTYIVNSARSKTGKGKIALYQPLTLLEMVVYHKENANILRIKEVKCFHPYQTLTTDFKKSTIALFLTEVINRAVKEQSHTQELGQFLFHAFISLDVLRQNIENFHLLFLVKLSRHLGFGVHQPEEILTPFFADDKEEKILEDLLTAEFGFVIQMNQVQRRNLLDVLLRFYASHVENFSELKSLSVVRELIN
ncbi:MAG: DNA repair protein RecO [Cytophagales bacterium]|jgi:DNA repair protein RecO (recombination protein O)|nr:DNA repair protein RecO [Cytophagales bacterium]MCA6365840.1 DNA repair protein RecO [Cytophagales bacterium]MCA6371236.1 DNA repair protein RecO [Cytophagales bacterium]MCA6374997.1 DNA repair protein RecO [Cytophagales bacterium]MCA6382694.1 DNA repair protein RecO [Cytophagales bacterium]